MSGIYSFFNILVQTQLGQNLYHHPLKQAGKLIIPTFLGSMVGDILCDNFDAKTGCTATSRRRVNLKNRQVGSGCHSIFTLYSKHVEYMKVLLHYFKDIAKFVILLHILAKHPDQNGFLVHFVAKIKFFLSFCTGNQIS